MHRIETVLAAALHLAGWHAMVVQAGEALVERDIVDLLARIDRGRIGIDQRGNGPPLARKACGNFLIQGIVIADELKKQWAYGEQRDYPRAEQPPLDRPADSHRLPRPRSPRKYYPRDRPRMKRPPSASSTNRADLRLAPLNESDYGKNDPCLN